MRTKRVYIKALLLLTVFSMNTIVGTACSLSKVFHSSHHHGSSASNKHSHTKGTHSHKHHTATDEKHTEHGSDECCSKSSIQFDKLDKSIAQSLEIQAIGFSSVVLISLHNTILLISRNKDRSLISHVRWRLPATIQDLRIVMQSFQI